MSEEWIMLDQRSLDKPMQINFKGKRINVHISPYDLPEAVRSILKDGGKTCSVEFRYFVEDEPERAVEVGEFATARVGKNSGRLYRLELDLDRLQGEGIIVSAIKAITSLIGQNERRSRPANYEVVKEAVEETPQLECQSA